MSIAITGLLFHFHCNTLRTKCLQNKGYHTYSEWLLMMDLQIIHFNKASATLTMGFHYSSFS